MRAGGKSQTPAACGKRHVLACVLASVVLAQQIQLQARPAQHALSIALVYSANTQWPYMVVEAHDTSATRGAVVRAGRLVVAAAGHRGREGRSSDAVTQTHRRASRTVAPAGRQRSGSTISTISTSNSSGGGGGSSSSSGSSGCRVLTLRSSGSRPVRLAAPALLHPAPSAAGAAALDLAAVQHRPRSCCMHGQRCAGRVNW